MPKQLHPAELYARSVLRGEITVGKWVRRAVERQEHDLAHAAARGYWFDRDAAARTIQFFGFLRHSKGEWARQPFQLSPWQQFLIWVLYGWKHTADGLRRFRTAYNEIARKNGKSTLAAGVALKQLAADGEQGAEVYSAATKREQARLVHEEATRMVRASPALRKKIQVYRDNLCILASNSKFEPLGADGNTMDGLNVSTAIIDEFHAHKTREVYDVLDTATGSRRQPLMFLITTAGFNRVCVCHEVHEYSRRVLEGFDRTDGHKDDTFFAWLATIDDGDDWTDSAVWIKANPGLHVSVKLDDLERKCRQAIEMPTAQNNFRTKHLNQWTSQFCRWIPMEKWDAAKPRRDLAELAGKPCFLGLDLASTRDVAAVVLVFPEQKETETTPNAYDVLPFFFVPAETLQERGRESRVDYQGWARDGHLIATPGNAIDYDRIRAHVNALANVFQIRAIAADRWNAVQIALQLQGDGFEVVFWGQGFASMNAPSKDFERLIADGNFRHGAHPVLTWMAANVAAETDAAGNIKPSKKASSEKIDGIVAAIMALGVSAQTPPPKKSIYETRGLILVDS